MARTVKVVVETNVMVGLSYTALPHEKVWREGFNPRSFGAEVGKRWGCARWEF